MMIEGIEQQEHGYRNGHQLLSATLKLPRDDQDTVDRLSDISGGLRPNEQFGAYLTAYPLPSQSHFVLARTWQDLNARRAGCVLTRSLLIPMRVWQGAVDFSQLVSLLTPVAVGDEPIPIDVPMLLWPPPPVPDARYVELSEALFLEKRQGIVVFEATDADAAVIRVLASLWPGLRRRFAVCSFALGPRQISSRDFDLLFAPKSARSRFSEWPGRKIDTDVHAPRHRWSSLLYAQIFESTFPSLTQSDTLELLGRDTTADESTLRLTLMWNELALRAQSAPTAVLGMLDIANSLNEVSLTSSALLDELVNRATNMAANAAPAQDGWAFLKALLGKYSNRFLSKPLSKKVKSTATALTLRDVATAEEFLRTESQAAQSLPLPILAGIGRGLCVTGDMEQIAVLLRDLNADARMKLLTQSPSLMRSVVARAAAEPSRWLGILMETLKFADQESLSRFRRITFSLLTSRNLAPIIPGLLKYSTPRELKRLTIEIGRLTQFSVEEFDEPIIDAARDAASLNTLRHAIADYFVSREANRFLAKTFHVNSADLSWLSTGELAPDRSRDIALRLLEDATDRDIREVQQSEDALEHFLALLVAGLPQGAPQVARLLLLCRLRLEVFLDSALSLLGLAEPMDSPELANKVLERAFSEALTSDTRVAQALALVGSTVGVQSVIRHAVPTHASVERVGANLEILDQSTDDMRAGIISRVDELCDRLITRRRNRLPEHANITWSKLIRYAGAQDRSIQLKASISTLAYALQLRDSPVSALIVESFPVVYEQLLLSKGEEDFKTIPYLLTLPMSFFQDWDRAKSARQDLIRAFLHSSWPPTDLLITAMKARIDQTILKRLNRDESGRRYIAAIEKLAALLPVSERSQVNTSLSAFRNGLSNEEW